MSRAQAQFSGRFSSKPGGSGILESFGWAHTASLLLCSDRSSFSKRRAVQLGAFPRCYFLSSHCSPAAVLRRAHVRASPSDPDKISCSRQGIRTEFPLQGFSYSHFHAVLAAWGISCRHRASQHRSAGTRCPEGLRARLVERDRGLVPSWGDAGSRGLLHVPWHCTSSHSALHRELGFC